MGVSIGVVDPSPYLAGALEQAARFMPDVGLTVSMSERSWTDFGRRWDFGADRIVIRAELQDHVPVVLKVRALTRLRVSSIVIQDSNSEPQRCRLQSEGVATVVSSELSLSEFVRVCVSALPPPKRRTGAEGPGLTDRELQIACLYCSRAAPSSAYLARLLTLSENTVRSHLRKAREKMRTKGYEVSTRSRFRGALVSEGWLCASM